MRTDAWDRTWTHLEDPDEDEQAWLRDALGLPADWVRDSLDPYQRPRFQRSGELVLILVLCPRTARRRPEPFATVPLGIVLLPERAVTICRRDPDLIDDVRGSGGPPARNPPGIALALLLANEEVFRRDLRAIHDRSTFEEEELRALPDRGAPGQTLIDQGRSLAYFDSALRSDGRMLDAVRDDGLFEGDGACGPRSRRSSSGTTRTPRSREVFSRIHADLMDGFSSLVSMNLNALVRTLTEITIALAVPAIIAALWGMNVPLPLEEPRDRVRPCSPCSSWRSPLSRSCAIRFAERIGPRLTRRS